MKISLIKYDMEKSFNRAEKWGMNVVKLHNLEELEKTDEIIEELICEDYNTILVTNQVAGYSQSMIDKYNKEDNVRIIIVP